MTSSTAFAARLALATTRRTARAERVYNLGSCRWSHPHAYSRTAFPPTFRRTFFGIGEVLGILANPGETLRSLADSKRLLEETRAEMLEQKERAQIPPKHTFSPLPGFFHRKKEIKVIETCLSSVPNFTVVFGGTSVGKTALLRQVLTHERYHVLHFDLRIAGFADLSSLFFSLSFQMEQFFVDLASRLEGYDTFEMEALAFKHARLDVERRVEKSGARVKTSDIAHLLELFQSSLLKYWEFTPKDPNDPDTNHGSSQKPMKEWEKVKLENAKRVSAQADVDVVTGVKVESVASQKPKGLEESRSVQEPDQEAEAQKESQNPPDEVGNPKLTAKEEEIWKPPTKKVPVFFLDEAHKLPALIKDKEAMNCILDALLVLTKQDRLCHVLHASSDPFYLYWLRDHVKVLAHCTIITIGDPCKAEAEQYFNENLIGILKKKLDQQPVYDARRGGEGKLILKHEAEDLEREGVECGYTLEFETIYRTFGGKLAHLQGFVGDYLNSGGILRPEESSQFLQAYALLHYHLVRTEQKTLDLDRHRGPLCLSNSSGLQSFVPSSVSPCTHSAQPFITLYPALLSFNGNPDGELASHSGELDEPRPFSSNDLLYVIQSLTKPPESNLAPAEEYPDFRPPPSEPMNRTLPYFKLCREIGVGPVDAMIRKQILDLRWNRSVSAEEENHVHERGEANPMVLPVSPVMRCAMKKVLDEYIAGDSGLAGQ